MKQQYVTPEWRIHRFDLEDVLTMSNENDNDNVASYGLWTTGGWTD